MQNAPPAREGTNPGVLSGGPQGCNRRGDRSYVTSEDPDAPFSSARQEGASFTRVASVPSRAPAGSRETERERGEVSYRGLPGSRVRSTVIFGERRGFSASSLARSLARAKSVPARRYKLPG